MTARRFTARLCLGIAMAFGLAGPAWSTNAVPEVEFLRQSYMTEDKVTFGIGAWKDPGPEASIMWEHTFATQKGNTGQIRLYRNGAGKGIDIGLEGTPRGAGLSSLTPEARIRERAGGTGYDATIPYDWKEQQEVRVELTHTGKDYIFRVGNHKTGEYIATVAMTFLEDGGGVLYRSWASTLYGKVSAMFCEDVRYARGRLTVFSDSAAADVEVRDTGKFTPPCLLTNSPSARDNENVGSLTRVDGSYADMEVGLARKPNARSAPSAWQRWEDKYVRVETDGSLSCYSRDGATCANATPFDNKRQLVCGDKHKALYGITGYDTPGHWCNAAYATLFAQWASEGDRRWTAKLPSGDVMCYSGNARNCISSPTRPTPAQRGAPLVCGAMHQSFWGETGYRNPAHWCVNGPWD